VNIAELIKSKRTAKELSYRELSELTGVSHTYIRDVEMGKYAPSFENAEKLAKVLGIEIEQIVLLIYQSQMRQTLFDLITACHKYQIKLTYDEWLKTSLPLQPLNQDNQSINDFAVNVLNRLHLIANQEELKHRLNLLSEINSLDYDQEIFNLISDIVAVIHVTSKLADTKYTVHKFQPLLDELKNEIKAKMEGDKLGE